MSYRRGALIEWSFPGRRKTLLFRCPRRPRRKYVFVSLRMMLANNRLWRML